MIVEFPLFGAGIIYFPTELSALRVFEPRYLLLIADAIKQRSTFCVSSNLDEENQVISEVEIIEHRDISNAEQLVLVKCINLYKIKSIKIDKEYPVCNAEIIIDVGLPPKIEELKNLQIKINKSLSELIDKGLDIDIPTFEIDTENRILSLWEICTKIPMTMDLRNKLLLSNDINYRFKMLESYLEEIKERTI
jgi:Lon protease-like protein